MLIDSYGEIKREAYNMCPQLTGLPVAIITVSVLELYETDSDSAKWSRTRRVLPEHAS